MHEGNYQQLYHFIFDAYTSQEQTLMFNHFLEQIYNTSAESSIDHEDVLLENVNF